MALTALGGAINRVGRTDTAFVHRGSRILAQYLDVLAGGHARHPPSVAEFLP